jgi:Lrp/AsnC family transcriptional regulator, leucine-responsive regulatory protein
MSETPKESKVSLDRIDRRILTVLQQDARLSYVQIGKRVGLSPTAVAERVHRLEDAGVIQGYHARLDPTLLGFPIISIIHLTCPGNVCPHLRELVEDMLEIQECHSVTGDVSAIMKVAVSSVSELESFVHRLGKIGKPSSAIVLSSPVPFRELSLLPKENAPTHVSG